jgi:hypothetical protein
MPQLYIAKYTRAQSKCKSRWITAMRADGSLMQRKFRKAKIIQLFQQYERRGKVLGVFFKFAEAA